MPDQYSTPACGFQFKLHVFRQKGRALAFWLPEGGLSAPENRRRILLFFDAAWVKIRKQYELHYGDEWAEAPAEPEKIKENDKLFSRIL